MSNEQIDTPHKVTIIRLTNVVLVRLRLVRGEEVVLVDGRSLLEVIEELGFDKTDISLFVDARLLRLPIPAVAAVVPTGGDIVVFGDKREVPEEIPLGANGVCELGTGTCGCLI